MECLIELPSHIIFGKQIYVFSNYRIIYDVNDLEINVRFLNLIMRFAEEVSFITISISYFKNHSILNTIMLVISIITMIIDIILLCESYYQKNDKSRNFVMKKINHVVKNIIKSDIDIDEDDYNSNNISNSNVNEIEVMNKNIEEKNEILRNKDNIDEIEDSKKTRGSFSSNISENSSSNIKAVDDSLKQHKKIDNKKIIDSINENSDVNSILKRIGEAENISKKSKINNIENDDYIDVIPLDEINKKIMELKSYSTNNKKNFKNSMFKNDKDNDISEKNMNFQNEVLDENSKIICKTDENLHP